MRAQPTAAFVADETGPYVLASDARALSADERVDELEVVLGDADVRDVVGAVDHDALRLRERFGDLIHDGTEEGGALSPAGQQRRSVEARQRVEVELERVGVV